MCAMSLCILTAIRALGVAYAFLELLINCGIGIAHVFCLINAMFYAMQGLYGPIMGSNGKAVPAIYVYFFGTG